MPCPSGKVAHPTREAALAQVRELEYKNTRRGHDVLSAGLEAYPCRRCDRWHVGDRHVPTVWHYDTVAVLDTISDAAVLTPGPSQSRARAHFNKPRRGLAVVARAVGARARACGTSMMMMTIVITMHRRDC